MSLASILTQYATLNVLLILTYLGLKMLFYKNQSFKEATKLKWHYALLFLSLLATLIHPFIPSRPVFTPTAKVWSASTLKSFSSDYDFLDKGGYLKMDVMGKEQTIDGQSVFDIGLVIFCPLLLIVTFLLVQDLKKLTKIRNSSYLYKRYKNVQILLNDHIQVPFSYMFLQSAYVIIPTALLGSPDHFKIALLHEIQHHRQGDTRLVYMIWFLKLVCFFNPAIHLLGREISRLQEFSCDETLIGHKEVSAQSYAHCLIAVAQTSLLKMKAPLCATGLTFLTEDHLLKRRIKMMYSPRAHDRSVLFQSFVFSVFLSLFVTSAYAAKSFVQDKRVSVKEAQSLIKNNESPIPLEINDLVLKQINRYVGTPEGRDFFRASLTRMQSYKTMIAGKLTVNKLPLELLAVPIVESGYQNLKQPPKNTYGAGIWMFIKSTARVYGLRVDDEVDERLDSTLLTEAAAKYFQSNYARFNDWHLALLAYNIGEANLEKAMKELNTRDAWTVIRNGRENDKDYLPRVIAAIIIMQHPELLE